MSPDVFSPYLTLLRSQIDEVVAASKRADFRAQVAELASTDLKRIAELAGNMDFFMGLLVALHEMFIQRDRFYRTAVADGKVEYRAGWETYCEDFLRRFADVSAGMDEFADMTPDPIEFKNRQAFDRVRRLVLATLEPDEEVFTEERAERLRGRHGL